MKVLVTGGAGFIGSCLVRKLVREHQHQVLNVDALTYAGHLVSLDEVTHDRLHEFERIDITDAAAVSEAVERFQPDAVVHLAAESHVDRSVDGPGAFVETNVTGTYVLLEACRRYWQNSSAEVRQNFKFIHVSTDEVYGSLGDDGYFTESTPYAPTSPYSATKAAADHLARAWHATFGMPVVVTHCSNNYGPYQMPEKLIPLMVMNAISDRQLPVYGAGTNVRDWLHVEDHVDGLVQVLLRGAPGETYNFGGNCEVRNIDVVKLVCRLLDAELPRGDGISYLDQIAFVADRPGHDLRYAVCADKASRELDWQPKWHFEDGLRDTIRWYLHNRRWCSSVSADQVSAHRLGLGSEKKQVA